MRPTLGLAVLAATLMAGAAPALAKPTAQAKSCSVRASKQHLTGAARSRFLKTCQRGPMAPKHPTAPTGQSPEAQAITKPSGVDRTTRSKQCSAEADRRGLAEKERSAFRLSCLATAGPVTEGETGTQMPHPAKAIKGIGVNNYKDKGPATSKPAVNAPEAIKPKP